MKFCWQARRALPAVIEGTLAAPLRPALEAHLSSCPACRAEQQGQALVRQMLGESAAAQARAAGAPWRAPRDFEERVIGLIRARRSAAADPAQPFRVPRPAPRSLNPFALGAAAAIMLVAGLLALFLGRPAGPGGGAGDATTDLVAAGGPSLESDSGDPEDLADDRLAPPREVPFTVREDLTGPRRGRIPLTTYVLEPAPEEQAVVRASL